MSAADLRNSTLLDQMLAEQEAGTYIDPVEQAKATTARLDRAEHLRKAPEQIANLAATSGQELQTERDLRRAGTESGVLIDAAKQGLYGAAIPLSMTGGGAGIAAGGYLALNALNDFVDNPGWGTGAGAVLDMIPMGLGKAAKAVTRLARGSKAAEVAPGLARSRYMQGMAERTKPSAGGYVAGQGNGTMPIRPPVAPTPAAAAPQAQSTGTSWDFPSGAPQANVRPSPVAPTPAPRPQNTGTMWGHAAPAAQGVDDVVARAATPAGPVPSPASEFDAAMEQALKGDGPSIEVVEEGGGYLNNASGDSAASIEALQRASGMASRGEKFGYFDRSGQFKELIGPEAVDFVPRQGQTYGKMTPNGFETLSDMGGRVTQPAPAVTQAAVGPTGRAVTDIHPAQTDAGAFGFEDLGSISEGELTRMQQGQWPTASREVPSVGSFEDYWKARGRKKPFDHPKAPEKKAKKKG